MTEFTKNIAAAFTALSLTATMAAADQLPTQLSSNTYREQTTKCTYIKSRGLFGETRREFTACCDSGRYIVETGKKRYISNSDACQPVKDSTSSDSGTTTSTRDYTPSVTDNKSDAKTYSF